MTTFCLPDLGEGLQEAEILNWHVGAGDHVSADQPIVSVETDKAVIEIPAPESGQVVKLFAAPGDIVQVGAPLLEYGTEQAADTGAIVGELEKEETEPDTGRAEGRPEVARGEQPATARLSVAPAVRRLAAELGVDLRTVDATGRHGEITATDVRNAGAAETGRLKGVSEELRGVRRAMAIRMHEAGREVVPASLHDEADLAAWKDTDQLLPRAVLALVHAARDEPSLNVWYDRASQTRTLFDVVNIGIAVDTPDGLIVPVLKDAASIPRGSLQGQLEDLIDDARNRTIKPDELRGATISLSNFGSLGGRYANLVVVPPQVAILGIGRASGSPPRLPLSLTMDHRAVSGGEAARFLSAFIGHLEAAEQE